VKRAMIFGLAAAALWVLGVHGVRAQAVYKCGPHSYSQQPCSSRVVRTYDSEPPANPKPQDVVTRQLPGETVAEYTTRKRRSGLSEGDRDECARLDKRLPVELERLKKAQGAEVDEAQSALGEIRKRSDQLHC
jgi:hypothetical protein